MVSRSGMCLSDLRGELIEQVGVLARVDLATEQFGGCADRDARHLASQALPGAPDLELDLLLRGGDDARTLAAGCALGLLEQLVGAMLRVIDDLVGALARLAHDGFRLVVRFAQLLLALLGCRESLRDLARALLH